MRSSAVLLAVCAALPCCGCLYIHTCHEVAREQEPKRVVAFQSESASRLFCAVVERQKKAFREGQVEEFIVPFITYINKTRTISEAGFYNDQVAACDTNGDGVITDAEAIAYDRACGLVQTGQLAITLSVGPYEVRYPEPYASLPELTFPDGDASLVDTAKLEQTPQGFRAYIRGWTTAGALKWRARGVPARNTMVQVTAVAPEAPAAEVAPQVKLNGPVEVPEAPAK